MEANDIIKQQYKKGESGNPKGSLSVLPELKEAIARVLSNEKDSKTPIAQVFQPSQCASETWALNN